MYMAWTFASQALCILSLEKVCRILTLKRARGTTSTPTARDFVVTKGKGAEGAEHQCKEQRRTFGLPLRDGPIDV